MAQNLIRDIHDYVKEYCRDKVVLDLGMGFDPKHNYQKSLSRSIWDAAQKVYVVRMPEQRKNFKKVRIRRSNARKIRLIFGDFMNFEMSKSAGPVDVVVADDILETISNTKAFFCLVRKYLKDEGLLIVMTPNPYSAVFLSRLLFTGSAREEPKHLALFDYEALRRICRANGFVVVEHIYGTETEPGKIGNTLLRAFGSVFPIYNTNLMVVCRKEVKLKSKE